MTGVSECSQQRSNLKDDGYSVSENRYNKYGIKISDAIFLSYIIALNLAPIPITLLR
ncbi:hypothetical protein [Photorhabdus sp. S14-60]|uniref:hypothetical protein n=1 Tax=Photorhabdus sp. S14-60 TaxID=2029689 RepID=UPI0002E9E034|nr:hypothetical protein [Photorhabdus sp. S14-60]NDK95884.1 hypothetical protein [Photorhabdus laumondii subsp. laumondii]